MKVFIGADHRGFALKEKIKPWLVEQGYEITDVGATALHPDDDYTDFASAVAHNVAKNVDDRGIVMCGSGVGVDVVANKIDGIRSGYAATVKEVQSARRDDNINVLAIAADFTDEEKTKQFIKTFLETAYIKEERFERRIDKIEEIEDAN